MDGEVFGRTEEGETVQRFSIEGGGLSANIMTWGATLQNLEFEGHGAPLVLGYERFEDYPAFSPYLGATAGTLRQQDPGRQVYACRQTLSGRQEFSRQAHASWWRERLRQACLGRGAAWAGLCHPVPPFRRRRHGFSRRDRRHLHLPLEDPGNPLDRVHRYSRRAHALQSGPPFILQPRRWRQRRHPRSSPYAQRRRLPSCRR